MGSCNDFFNLGNEDNRIVAAFKEMVAGGVDPFKARSLITISMNETNTVWTVPRLRDDKQLWYPTPTACCRLVIGWEFAGSRDNPGVRHLPASPADRDQLVKMGVIDAAGKPTTRLKTGADRLTLIAKWFEFTIDRRDALSLQNFSMGPTQMFLFFAKVTGLNAGSPGFPDSFDDLWDYYTSMDCAAIASHIRYLEPSQTKTPWPAQNPGDRASILQWLIHQTGFATMPNGKHINENYFDGIGFRPFGKNLNHVIALTTGPGV